MPLLQPRLSLADTLRAAERELTQAGIEAARIQAMALLAHTTGLTRAALLARLREPLDHENAATFRSLIQARARHHPLQYLVGQASFLDFEVRVAPGVFIPRPETEQVVERVLALWEPSLPWAIDLCCGSGVIAIALARARTDSRVTAIDVSAVALASARASAADLGVADRIEFVRADLLAALQLAAPRLDRLGVLVCNPPYAPRAAVTQPEVRDHEPEIAWSGGPTGIEIYERLIPQAAALLPAGRPLVLELGYGQEASVPALLADPGDWSPPQIKPDFQGIPRVLSAHRR